MASWSAYDPIFDLVILVLILVLFYLWMGGSPAGGFRTKIHASERMRKDKELHAVRRKAMDEMTYYLERRGELERLIADAKRRYMHDEITHEALQMIIGTYNEEIGQIDAKLRDYEGLYG